LITFVHKFKKMSKYSSKPTIVNRPIGELYSRFNDLSFFSDKLNELPADQLSKIGDVNFTPDSISINTPQIGTLTFKIVERVEPTKVVFGSPGSPVPLTMSVHFKAVDENATEVSTVIDVEIPMMLRPLVGSKLQDAADKFGEMISNLAR